jgi:hypothetical protein
MLGIHLAQIKSLLKDIDDKLDALLKAPLTSAIAFFEASLNCLQASNPSTTEWRRFVWQPIYVDDCSIRQIM